MDRVVVVVVFLEDEEESEGAFFLYRGFRRRSFRVVELFDRPFSLNATRFIDGICLMFVCVCMGEEFEVDID